MRKIIYICCFVICIATLKSENFWTASFNGVPIVQINEINSKPIISTTQSGIFISEGGENLPMLKSSGLTDNKILRTEVVQNKIFAATNSDLFVSSDAGENWTNCSPMFLKEEFNFVKYINSVIYVGTWKSLFLSRDDGETWVKCDSALGKRPYFCIAQKDDKVFITTAGDSILVTKDDGHTWFYSYMEKCENFNQALYIKDTLCLVKNREYIISTDEGKTFLRPDSSLPNQFISKIEYINGYIFIYSSTKGLYYAKYLTGPWIRIAPNSGNVKPTCGAFIASRYYIGSDKGLYTSSDLSGQWKLISQGITVPNSNQLAYDKGDLLFFNIDGIFKSSNMGRDWKLSNTQFNISQPFVWQNNSKNYLLLSDSSYAVSDDKFATSQIKYFGMKNYISQILFINNIMMAVGNNGAIKSSNDGDTWVACNTGLDDLKIYSAMKYDNTIIISTEKGVYSSSNLGETWTKIFSDQFYTSFSVLNRVNDMIFGVNNNAIYSSTDIGASWNRIGNFTDYQVYKDFRDIVFLNDTLYAVSASKGIYKSGDLGKTWSMENSGLIPSNIDKIYNFAGNLLVTGINANIYYHLIKTDLNYNPQSDENIEIYPNPASNSISLKFNNLYESIVNFKIIDALGSALIIMRDLNTACPGDINVSQLSPGAYFIIFESGEKRIVKKLNITK